MKKTSDNNFARLREEMVEYQLIPRGIADPRVLAAFRKVARHLFVPANISDSAYDDCALAVGEGQTISQPYMVAVMTELLKLKGKEKVLEVGTGSGYQAAILAELCLKVYTIERLKVLSERAKNILQELGYANIEFLVGDGSQGYEDASPYEGIIVTAGCPSLPEVLVEQLADGGRLVLPVGDPYHQILTLVTKQGTEIFTEESIGCVFVPLVGRYGW